MKLTPFKDTVHDQPYHAYDGWYWDSYPPLSEPKCHGPYSTRAECRNVRRKSIKNSKGSGSFAEILWRKIS